MAAIDPPAGTTELKFDIPLDSGRSLVGTIVGPDGKPLAGAQVQGLDDFPSWTLKPLESPQFELHALPPDASRFLFFYHRGRKLAGLLEVKATDMGPLVAKLQPCGAASGRLIDDAGVPVSGVELIAYKRNEKVEKYVPSLPDRPEPGKDGRFQLEGLIPGERYEFWAFRRGRNATAIENLIVKPGETKELGDVRVVFPQ
jgi:hypothetical protein